jgi:hypothetical protein
VFAAVEEPLTARRALATGHPHASAIVMKAFAVEVRALRHAGILADDLADLWLFEDDNILAILQ